MARLTTITTLNTTDSSITLKPDSITTLQPVGTSLSPEIYEGGGGNVWRPAFTSNPAVLLCGNAIEGPCRAFYVQFQRMIWNS
jgi:hypothetical protein